MNWYDLIRDDVDEAIEKSDTFECFLTFLEKKGYKVRTGKYLSLRQYGKERAVISSRLGKEYRIDEIRMRIAAKDAQKAGMTTSVTETPTSLSRRFGANIRKAEAGR